MTLQGYTSNFVDEDLTPENVRKDKTIFWVEWTFEWLTSGWNWLYIWTYWIRVSYYWWYGNKIWRALEIWDYIYFISFWGVNWWSWIGWWAIVCSKINKNTWSITFVWFSELTVSWMSINWQIKSSYIDGTNIYINVWDSFGGWGIKYFNINTLNDTITVSDWDYTLWTLDNSTSKTFWGNTYTPQALWPWANYWWAGADALISVIWLS